MIICYFDYHSSLYRSGASTDEFHPRFGGEFNSHAVSDFHAGNGSGGGLFFQRDLFPTEDTMSTSGSLQ